jgi:hypothetical protein
MLSRRPTSVLLTLLAVLFLTHPSSAIKFSLPAQHYPPAKCIWNAAHVNALVIVTANVGPGANQRVDIEIIDSSPEKNVYLHKKGINGETRLAITSHAEGEVGVCFKNHLDIGVFFTYATKRFRRTDFVCRCAQMAPYETGKGRVSLIWMLISVRMPWITSTFLPLRV